VDNSLRKPLSLLGGTPGLANLTDAVLISGHRLYFTVDEMGRGEVKGGGEGLSVGEVDEMGRGEVKGGGEGLSVVEFSPQRTKAILSLGCTNLRGFGGRYSRHFPVWGLISEIRTNSKV